MQLTRNRVMAALAESKERAITGDANACPRGAARCVREAVARS
jgi:hypothetical protein